jgi:hypothetical protein
MLIYTGNRFNFLNALINGDRDRVGMGYTPSVWKATFFGEKVVSSEKMQFLRFFESPIMI